MKLVILEHNKTGPTGFVTSRPMSLPELEKAESEFGGWIWRYDLVPLGPSQTEVTLTYDWSAVP